MKKILLTIVFSCFLITQVNATHLLGAEISYSHISNNLYEIKLTTFEVSNPTTTNLLINYSNSCTSGTIPVTIDTVYSVPIPCTQFLSHFVVEYTAQFNFPSSNCSNYLLNYSAPCCMSPFINIIGASRTQEVTAEILDISDQNTSATFNSSIIKIAQRNSPSSIDLSATDINGDSLVYMLADASGNYESGYTFNDPFGPNGSTILDPNSGILTASPTQLGSYLLNVIILEYKNGIYTGKTQREWGILVYDNTNTNKNPSLSGINNTNNFSMTACIGDTIHFTANITDLDTNQIVTARLLNPLPNAKVTTSGRIVNFKWIVDSSTSAGTYYPTIQLDDQNCGVTNFPFNITVNPCITTNIIENKQNSFSVYPNPSQGRFTIKFYKEIINSTISVRSITGQLLKEINLEGNTMQDIDISNLESGIYFISIPTKAGTVSKKIILSK